MFSLTAFLMDLGLSEIAAGFGILVLVSGAVGVAYNAFRTQRNKLRDDATKQKADAAKEWREVADAHAEKIALLDLQVKTCKKEHENCELRINDLTEFNLRLQARERGYQRVINKLEIRSKLEPTDWNDITDAPSFDTR